MEENARNVSKILLIDDDKSFACFFSDAMEHFGVECEVICDSTGIGHHDLHQYGHVVIDLMMPHYDGLQILDHLKSVNFKGYISVVSGHEQSVLISAEELCNLHQMTFHSALQKPFDLEHLKKLTREIPIPSKRQTTFDQTQQYSEDEVLKSLRAALEKNMLDVHFQPKVNMQSGVIIGFEALARWNHEGQFIAPSSFIPIAENYGLSAVLSDQIISKSLSFFSEFQALYNEPTLSINLSASELQERKLPELLRTTINRYGIPADKIILEITETVLLEKNMISLEVLTRLRLIGFQLSIDDFGTGFSSVNMLQNGPFTELKIDRSFTAAINTNKQTEIIVQSIIDMANRLHLNLVAEGIEDEMIKASLTGMGCFIGQGYLFGKPMSAQNVINLAQTHSNRSYN